MRNEINITVLFIMVLNCKSKDVITNCCIVRLATSGQNHIAHEIPGQARHAPRYEDRKIVDSLVQFFFFAWVFLSSTWN